MKSSKKSLLGDAYLKKPDLSIRISGKVAFLFIVFMAVSPLFADDSLNAEHNDSEHYNLFAAETATADHHQAGHYHINMVELFMGNTYEDSDHGSENGFSFGLTYERRLSELVGVGGFFEYAQGDFEKWSIGVPLFIHPYAGWRFAFAPGLEHRHGKDEFLFRTGVAYEFELSESWVLMPEASLDLVDGQESVAFGLSIGFGF